MDHVLIGNKRTKVYHQSGCSHIPSTNRIKDLVVDNEGNVYDFQGNLYRPCSFCQGRRDNEQTTLDSQKVVVYFEEGV